MSDFSITDSASKHINTVLKKEPEGSFLRLSVQGGGCSGFQYIFSVDQTLNEDDEIFQKNDIRLAIDSISQPFVEGATLDFVDDLMGQYFKVENPNAVASCGCGTSFSI